MYWQPTDWQSLAAASSFDDCAAIALAILGRMPQPIGEVCGPISTGGRGSVEENLKAFDQTINRLLQEGKNIFDQVPFERPMFALLSSGKETRESDRLLTAFYLPIFESSLISTLYFMPDWQSSHGATWEHEQAKRLGMEIVYL